jgi:acyl transferase domain-containing protein
VSQTILLCEDSLHERLAKAYMKQRGLETQEPYVKAIVASQMQHGGNVDWVLHEFPKQVHACRQRNKKSKTLLIVLVDADQFTVNERRRQLNERLKQAGYEELDASDPSITVLIPRRHVETWVRALLAESVTEEEDCKDWNKPTKDGIRQAASTAHQWARPNATPGPTCVPSLAFAFPELRKIG